MKFRSTIPILRDCIVAPFILLIYLAVTNAQRSISYYNTPVVPPRLSLKQIEDVVANRHAFTALTRDGSVISWGTGSSGGRDASVSALTNVKRVLSVHATAFAAVTQDDTMYIWGASSGDLILKPNTPKPIAPLINAKAIASTDGYAYALLRNDGSVLTWGLHENGGDSSGVASDLTNVKHIAANEFAFAAIREDGRVVTWGKSDSGGDSSSVSSLLVDVVEIVPNTCAFAALTSNGDVVSWGCSDSGGSDSMYRAQGVKSIHPIHNGFLGVRHNGSVVAWGTAKALDNSNGLDLNSMNVTKVFEKSQYHSEVYLQQTDGSIAILTGYGVSSPLLISQLSKDVKSIVVSENNNMYVALKKDGNTVAWYNSPDGSVPSPFEDVLVDSIYSTYKGFVVMTPNNKVISRGVDFDYKRTVPKLSKLAVARHEVSVMTLGGDVQSWPNSGLPSIAEYVPTANVKDVRSTYSTILYLFNDGSFKILGSQVPTESQLSKMSVGVAQICSAGNAFAARMNDGTVVAWGSTPGGDTSQVADKLNNVRMVYQSLHAFAALKYDGSVVAWGNENFGGKTGNVASLLQSVTSIIPLTSGFSAVIGDRLIPWGIHNFPSNDMKFDGNVTDAMGNHETYAVFHGDDIVTTSENRRITNAKSLAYTQGNFAVLLKNGQVTLDTFSDIEPQLVNVQSLHGAFDQFAALKQDNTVVLWPKHAFRYYDQITQYLNSNTVLSIQTTERDFVAVTKRLDGFVDEYVVFRGNSEMVVFKDCRCELEVHHEFVLERSFKPTASPTSSPTAPTTSPTTSPTRSPTTSPTMSPTASPTYSPTATPTAPTAAPSIQTGTPTSSPTTSYDAVPQQNNNSSESVYIGVGVGTTAGLIVIASAAVVYRMYLVSPHKANAEIVTKSLSSDNPTFLA